MLFKWREFVDDIVYGVGESTQLHRTPNADYKAPLAPPSYPYPYPYPCPSGRGDGQGEG